MEERLTAHAHAETQNQTGPGPLSDPRYRRLAIIMPSWVGDTVMATPVLRAIRRARPEAHLTAFVRPGLDDLLAGADAKWCDAVQAAPFKGGCGLIRTIRAVRDSKPDAVLLLPNSLRAAVIARASGAGRRIGYDRDGRGRLLTDRVPLKHSKRTPVSAVTYYAELAETALGVTIDDRRPELTVTDAERDAARSMLDDVPRPFVLLNPGANRADKRWPAERFAEAANRLHDSHNVAAAVTGSPAETDLVQRVVAGCAGPVFDLTGRGMTLSALKAVAAEAAVLITNDTGPRHIAAAVGTPVVALFGPTDFRWTRLPGVCEHPLLSEPFLPEEFVADDHPQHCAIDRIPVCDVAAAAGRLLPDGAGRR